MERRFRSSLAIRGILGGMMLAAAASAVAAQAAPTRINVNAAEISISGRIQAQLATSDAHSVQDAEIILRRARLGASVRVNELVSGRLHAEFAGSAVSLADAYMQVHLHPAFNLLAGRAHRPFGTIEQTSTLLYTPIERGLSIRGIEDYDLSAILTTLRYADRDVGLQLRGSVPSGPLGLGYAVGVFAGPTARQTGSEQTQQLVARLTANPAPPLKLGAAWSRRDFASESAEGQFEVQPGGAFVVDAEYGGPSPAAGLHIVAQAAGGDFDPFTGDDFRGVQIWMGYGIPTGERVPVIEPILRLSHASVDRADPADPDGGTLITPGLNVYLGGLNRIMINYDVWRASRGTDAASARVQFQMAF